METARDVPDSFKRSLLRMLSPRGARARLLILTYHRVLEAPDAMVPDEPDSRVFALQADCLATYCRVLPLPEAVRLLQAGRLPERAACITFDDGYANNAAVAAPILAERGLVATFFIAVDAVRRGIMWNDLVIEAVRVTSSELLAELGYGETEPTVPPLSRAAVAARLLQRLKYLPMAERWARAAALYQRLVESAPPRLMMTTDEVRRLHDLGHDIGAHTIHHPILRELSTEDARSEIAGSRDWLRDLLSWQPRSFAYPNGRPGVDYDSAHVAMVREAGFETAVSTAWGCANRYSAVYELPRFRPWESEPRQFWLRLAKTYLRSYWNSGTTGSRVPAAGY